MFVDQKYIMEKNIVNAPTFKGIELQGISFCRVGWFNKRNKSTTECKQETVIGHYMGKKDEEKSAKLVFRSLTGDFVETRSAKIKRHGKETDRIIKSTHKLSFLLNKDDTEAKSCSGCSKKLTQKLSHRSLCEAVFCDACFFYVNGSESEVPVQTLPFCEDGDLALKLIMKSREEYGDTKLMEIYKKIPSLKRQLSEAIVTYNKILNDFTQSVLLKDRIEKSGNEIVLLAEQIAEIPTEAGTRRAQIKISIQRATHYFVKVSMLELCSKNPRKVSQSPDYVTRITNPSIILEVLSLRLYTFLEENKKTLLYFLKQQVGSSMDIFDKTIELQTSSYDRVFGEHFENRRPVTINETDSQKSNIGSSMKKIFEKAKELQSTTLDRVFGSTPESRRPITISEAELRSKDLLELFNGKTDKEKVKLTSRSHTDNFVELRCAKIKNQGKETDIILENLNKYLNNEKPDRSLWQVLKIEVNTEVDTNICFDCKKHFKLTRRKHHCKLCEIVLCDNCSLFIDANVIGSALSKYEAKQVLDKINTKPLRHCKDCHQLLKVIKARSTEEEQDTKLIDTYKEMQNLKRQLAKTVITYKEIHESLVKGKIIHDLSQAALVKDHIGKRGREIAVLGKVFGETSAQAGTRQAKIYATIEKATDDFVKELLALPKVPTTDAVEESRLRRLSNNSVKSRINSGLEWDEIL